MKLYELTAAYRKVQDLSAEIDVTDTLEAIEGDIEQKAQNLLFVVANLDSDAKAIDDEIKRLQSRKKAVTNRQDSLRDYLRHNMQKAEINKIQCPQFTITRVPGRDVADVYDESQVTTDYRHEPKAPAPNKALILKALKGGYEVPGAKLSKSKEAIRIA